MNEDRSSIKILLYISILLNVVLVASVYYFYHYQISSLSPLSTKVEEKKLPLQKYSYKELSNTIFKPQDITFGPVIDEATEETPYETHTFYFEVEGKKMSGLAHFPMKEGTYPVLIMLRGYVDPTIYEPGIGSSPAARYFATNGYITLAPDYFGYAESDNPPTEPFADRLISYSAVLQLLADIKKLNSSFEESNILSVAQEKNIGIWAHSNGGQIALSTLIASGKNMPTVLWAPVSKPFPYSVLYFTDEFDDNGRYMRKLIAEFEQDYDIESFSLTNYLDQIKAPIQLQQGAKDDAVPIKWSNQLNDSLQEQDIKVEYITYDEADHNMRPNWDESAKSSLAFFDSYLKDN